MPLDLFAENILDHYRNPRNKGFIENPDIVAGDSNPLCGDVIDFQLKFNGNKIFEARFQGSGCAISQASASMLAEKIEGMPLEQAKCLSARNVFELLGIEVSGQRAKCALLPLWVLRKAISEKLGEKLERVSVLGEDGW